MKRFLSSLVPVIAALALAGPASAQVPGQTVQVNARVNTACTVDSGAGDVILSTVLADTGAIPATGTGAVTVRCTRGTNVSVAAASADAGFGRSATCTLASAATCGADALAYSLYVSSAGWTGAAASTLLSNANVPLGASPNKGTVLTINYQAQFAPAADPRAGDYAGSVAVTYTVAP